MKKIFYLASIAALAFSSCAKDETTEAQIGTVTGGIEIVAAMESNETRTQLVENGNGGFELVWNGEDAIYVYENADATENIPMKGLRFGLKGGSDGTATGSFYYNSNGGNVDELSAEQKYVAFYPAAPTASELSWDKVIPYGTGSAKLKNQLNLNGVKVNLTNQQTYLPKSFAPGVVPAISKEFTVNADGTATVKMQPMVDYLMVEVHATADVENLYLQLWEVDAEHDDVEDYTYNVLPIAGEAVPTPYLMSTGELRYYISEKGLIEGGNAYHTIKLSTGNLADNVSYKDANTYVFAIPGGILGSARNIVPVIAFSDLGSGSTFSDWDHDYNYVDAIEYMEDNNIQFATATNDKINGDLKNQIYRYAVGRAGYGANIAIDEQENGIFWFNSVKAPVVYNPDGDFIIKNELDFFQYFSQYDNGIVVNGTNRGKLNAYVYEGLELDLTADNMKELLEAAVAADLLDDASALAGAIHAYVEKKGKFPTISNFTSVFKGNNLSIVDIDRPLAKADGLFGTIDTNAQVNNLNLSGLVAATVNESNYDYNNNGKTTDKDVKGYILAKEVKGSIDNISVADLTAEAVIGEGTLANFKEITIGEDGVDEELVHMIAIVKVNADFEIKAAAWDAMEDLGSVFHKIIPVTNGTDKHHVATLPEGAKYEDFTITVDNSTPTNVLSVLAGKNLSYWTGGKVTPVALSDSANLGNAAPYAYAGYKGIKYAEELAGLGQNDNAYLMKNLDLNGSNDVDWELVNMGTELYGNNLTIANLGMVEEGDGKNGVIAPFDVKKVTKLNIDGVNIVIKTSNGNEVTNYISGLAKGVEDINTVKFENLVIDAVAGDQQVDYAPDATVFVGWFTATANHITIVNSDVINPESNIKGLHGMVGYLDVEDTRADDELEAIFQNSNTTGVSVTVDEFAKYDPAKLYDGVASHVAVVRTSAPADLSFRNCGTPKFMYRISSSAADSTSIYVSYDYAEDVEVEINKKEGVVED